MTETQLHQSLKKHFGYDTFRPGQEKAIGALLSGKSAAAIFPTGSGKSLIYQLTAMHLPNLTLVVSPLLALMEDQMNAMINNGIPAEKIDSTLTPNESIAVRERVRNGTTKVLLVSVERFKNEAFRRFMDGVPISLMVIDEAHCISEWGHNFRPDYLKLPYYQGLFNIPQVLLLTATATPQVISDMKERFNIDNSNVIVTGFYRSNLSLNVLPTSESEKNEKLAEILLPKKDDATIVYVTLQKSAEDVAQFLRSKGLMVSAYHAGMKSADREMIQNSFMNGQIPIIVATIAFGMGIDKSDIRTIVHYDLPKSIEGYSQEIGRAGRDGKPSNCYVLANLDGVQVLENFVYGDTPERENIKSVIDDIKSAEDNWETQIYKLSTESNIRQLPLKTLLVYLEMLEVIVPRYSYFATYRFKTQLNIPDILARFKGERINFLKAIFDYSDSARVWTTVNFDKIIANYSTDRSRIVAALDYLHDQGMIYLESTQMTEVFSVNQSKLQNDEVVDMVYDKFIQKEEAEVGRIDHMIEMFGSESCLAYNLSTYFGENLEWKECGHCSVCNGKVAKLEKSISLKPLTKEWVEELLSDFKDYLPSNIDYSSDFYTRFLCGIHTPIFTKLKASSFTSYGKLADYRYAEVKEMVEVLFNPLRG